MFETTSLPCCRANTKILPLPKMGEVCPSPTNTFHRNVNRSGQVTGPEPVPTAPSRFGPRHCGQSSEGAADATIMVNNAIRTYLRRFILFPSKNSHPCLLRYPAYALETMTHAHFAYNLERVKCGTVRCTRGTRAGDRPHSRRGLQ